MAVATDRRPTSPSIADLIPPHNLDAEMALLGSMMISSDACVEVVPILARDDAKWFYRHSHRQLFEVLVDLYDANRTMDLEVAPGPSESPSK